MRNLTKKLLIPLAGCLLLAVNTVSEAADFAFNWTRQTSPFFSFGYLNCNRGDGSSNCGLGFGSDPDKTPFLQEEVSIGGVNYFHLIIGATDSAGNPINPTTANESTIPFAQEIFIQIQSGTDCNATACSFSGGDIQSGFGGGGSGDDPLRSNVAFTGNATGFPTRMGMKQVINESDMAQTFLKDSLALKPKITQTITTADMTASFDLDMSNSNYSTNTTPGLITNTVTLIGANAGIQGNFDATATTTNFTTANAQTPNITGGRYTYVAGAGWNGSTTTFTPGTYTYVDNGSANLTTLDWNAFRTPTDNVMRFGTTPGTRLRGGSNCKSGGATTPPVGC